MAERGQQQNSDDADMLTSLSPIARRSPTLAEGGNVKQTFINSSVNVVAGDNIHVNKVVYNTISAEGEADQSIRFRKLVEICNENTKELTATHVLEDFRHENFQQPNFKVYPQMRQVDAREFYKGGYGNTSFDGSENKVFRNQLTREVGFLRQENTKARSIEVDDLMASIWQNQDVNSSKTVGVTAIVASAGSGKSTLTRRIAQQALRSGNEYPQSNGKKMVHFVELKDIDAVDKIKPSEFLFAGLYEDKYEEYLAFKWLDKHQSEAILIFDGLDQARWDFDMKFTRKIRKYEQASSQTVMYNILSRHILRHVKIYIASREFKVSELPAMARPETIITLSGLTLEDAHRLFAFLLGEIGEDLWQKIETMSPRLLNLVSVPVFLILTAVVMGRDPSEPPPTTVTELYKRIISALERVENIRNREEILLIVNKLKALAFRGMNEGRVVFKETDLRRFQLSASEVQDLMMKVPGSNLLSRHLMHGDFTFFFCHQSIQEYLAANFVAEMEFIEFSRFNEDHLHEERWSVVRRFVTGVVFSKSLPDLNRVSDQTKKQQVLDRSIRSQLEEKTGKENNYSRMELYTAIYESDNGDMIKHLSVVDASYISLSRDEAHIIGSLAARIGRLHSLDLSACNINDELLGIIARCANKRINIDLVNLSDSKFSAIALRRLLTFRGLESRSGNLYSEVVHFSVDALSIELKNEDDGIKISGGLTGYFNKQQSTLVLERCDYLAHAAYFGLLFDAKSIKCSRHLYAKQDDLLELSEWKLEKIGTILLDCTEERKIDCSFIETFVRKYRAENLDIVVNGQTCAKGYQEMLELRERICALGFRVNIHAIYLVEEGDDDFLRVAEECKKKVKYIRCIFHFGCGASPSQISHFVKKSNPKKLTLIYRHEAEMLERNQIKQEDGIDTEFHILKLYRDAGDAWQHLDEIFYERG